MILSFRSQDSARIDGQSEAQANQTANFQSLTSPSDEQLADPARMRRYRDTGSQTDEVACEA